MTANAQEKVTEENIHDQSKIPIRYDVTKEQIEKLKEKFSNLPDVETKEGYAFIKSGIKDLTKCRTSIEKRRKELKADALAYGKRVDDVAKELTEAIAAIEAPMKVVKDEFDTRKEREEEEARQKEAARVNGIKQRISEIKTISERLLGADSKKLQAARDNMLTIKKSIDDNMHPFAEYVDSASDAVDSTLSKIQTALDQRIAFEQQQAALDEQRQQEEKRQKELDEQQAKLDKERREFEEKKAAFERQQQKQQEPEKEDQVIEEPVQEVKAIQIPDDYQPPSGIEESTASNDFPAKEEDTEQADIALATDYLRNIYKSIKEMPIPDVKDRELSEEINKFRIQLFGVCKNFGHKTGLL